MTTRTGNATARPRRRSSRRPRRIDADTAALNSATSESTSRTATTSVTGQIRMNMRGFGFIDAGDSPDVFVRADQLRGFLDGDVVKADVVTKGTKTSGQTLQLIERNRHSVVGIVELFNERPVCRIDPAVAGWFAFLAPSAAALEGLSVEVTLKRRNATIVANLGAPTSPAAIRALVMSRYNLNASDDYSADTLIEGAPTGRHSVQRRDLTELATLTIDGEQSRDLDDALSVTSRDDGTMTLYVHIADVAEHVTAGSNLDRSAQQQTTSVYLPGWNRPMLPRSLSEDLCSLLPGVRRDTLTAQFNVSEFGDVSNVAIYESAIVSDHRLTYTSVENVLLEPATSDMDAQAARLVRDLAEVARRLDIMRCGRGSTSREHDTQTLDVCDIDGETVIVGIPAAPEAHALIERCMVATNEAVGVWLVERDLAIVCRSHDSPSDRRGRIAAFSESVGVKAPGGETITASSIADWMSELDELGGTAATAGSMLLRFNQERARYIPRVAPHFGLAAPVYVHFTSPIRRYADLAVHRIVKAHLGNGNGNSAVQSEAEQRWAQDVADACDRDANRAARAERETRAMMWLSTMRPGDQHSAVVTGCEANYVRVSIAESGVSGTVSYDVLNAHPSSDGYGLCALSNTTSEVAWSLGDKINVSVAAVDVLNSLLTLEPLPN